MLPAGCLHTAGHPVHSQKTGKGTGLSSSPLMSGRAVALSQESRVGGAFDVRVSLFSALHGAQPSEPGGLTCPVPRPDSFTHPGCWLGDGKS